MPAIDLREKIKQGFFLLDGAMGTQLMARGVEVGKCNDSLNTRSPWIIFDIHTAYLKAGCDAIITNTLSANKITLARHGLSDRVVEINQAGARIARQATGSKKYVLGDIGPSGDFLEPLGPLKADELRDAFAGQVEALLAGGVDGFIIETVTAIEEAIIAVEAAKSAGKGLPVLVSMSFDKVGDGFKTMMGTSVEIAAAKIVPLGIEAFGFNCGTASLDEYVELARACVTAVRALSNDVAICAEPNAGKPELVGDKTVYKVSADDFASAAEKMYSAGANIIGGCCGTSPEHIEAAAKLIRELP